MDDQPWIPLCSCALSQCPPKFNVTELNVLWPIYVSRAEAGMILENEYIHTPWMKNSKRIYDNRKSVTMKHLVSHYIFSHRLQKF